MEFEEENIENMPQIIMNEGIISESDLFDIYEIQYNDIFSKILKISEEKFFALLQEHVLLNLRLINKLSDLSLMSYVQELLSERYRQDKEKAEKDLSTIQKIKNDELIFLDYNNCYIHCNKNLEIKHKCGNKLILYNEFIYCIQCKNVYTEKQIKLFCDKCNKNYLSQIRKNIEDIDDDNDDDEILYPVAFNEKHGCKNSDELLNNDEKVKCLECESELYFNLAENDDNFLICTKCKLMFDRRNIKFKCNYCGEKFSSNVKIYNNFSEKKNNIIFLVHTLRKEKLAFPDNIQNKKCKCDFQKIKEFKHSEDNGNLKEGNYFGIKKIVCDICFQIWDKEKFIWVCPLCGDEFNEQLKKSDDKIKNNNINSNNNNNNNKNNNILQKKEKEKKEINEEEKDDKIDVDIYDENFEDYEESTQDIKDTKNIKEKNKPIEIYEYKKEENFMHMINNDDKNKEIKSKQNTNKTNKNYNVVENNKTIKIDLPPPAVQLKSEKNYKITQSNRIRDKKFYINNQYHTSSNKRSNENNNNSNKDNSSKIVINRRNKNNIVESKYSSNTSNNINNFNRINNNIQKRLEHINNREKNNIKININSNNNNNKNNFINSSRSNHQIKTIKETNSSKNIKVITNRRDKEKEKEKEDKSKKNENIKEFKNIQKYFNDFNEEYTKELEKKKEQKKKNQIKYIYNNNNYYYNNNFNNNEPKKEIKQEIKMNNILHNIKHTSNKEINNNIKQNLSSNKLNIIQEKKPTSNLNLNQLNTYKEITSLNSSNYKNIKVLGQGSYGKIYLVEDINTKEQYAMKKLILGDKLELRDNQDEYNMIMNIISTYPELNIIHVYATETKNFDEYNFVFYVLMEVANCDWEKELLNRQKEKAYYTEEEIVYILQSLVDTFSYLQQIGVCHRDIKPQNILCFGEKGYKISDFGEAKFRKKWRLSQNIEGYTSMQTVRGTELYMSPILYRALKTEPSKGVNHNVFKSDVFSLGMCFLFASCLDYKCLYDMRKVKNMIDVKNLVNKYVNNKYSYNFVDILTCMLNLYEKDRPDFIELSNMV